MKPDGTGMTYIQRSRETIKNRLYEDVLKSGRYRGCHMVYRRISAWKIQLRTVTSVLKRSPPSGFLTDSLIHLLKVIKIKSNYILLPAQSAIAIVLPDLLWWSKILSLCLVILSLQLSDLVFWISPYCTVLSRSGSFVRLSVSLLQYAQQSHVVM